MRPASGRQADRGVDLPEAPAHLALPPDLELQVHLTPAPGGASLTYVLHSIAAGFHFETIPGPVLKKDPGAFAVSLFEQIERLHQGYDVDGGLLLQDEAEKELASLGQSLYRELFPEKMREAYRRFRGVKSIQITSDEPAIPWELIKPYDDEREPIINDDFFCMQFQLTRWRNGRTPISAFPVRKLACVGSDELPNAAQERDLLARLAARHPGVDNASPRAARYKDVERLLEKGGCDLLHFIGHGDLSAERANEAKIVLEDRPFRARNLTGAIQTRLKKDRPLVFLNACRVGRQAWSLTGLGGWVEAWVRTCECGAFLGPQWAVSDSQAYEFATIFYRELEHGRTLGEAALEARHEVRRNNPDRPTWLAFAVYGHPNARVSFGLESGVSQEGNEARDARDERDQPVSRGRGRAREDLIISLSRNSDRARRSLDPYLLPRISRQEVHKKYLPAIRESVAQRRSRVIPILGSAGFGKSTLLGEIYDSLRSEDVSWVGLVDSAELSLSSPTDLPFALGRTLCDTELPFDALTAELSRHVPGVLLIDTLDLVLSPNLVPHFQRLLFGLEDTATTVVFTCRDVDYQFQLEPPRLRLPQIADRIDRYLVPAFTPPEVALAARAFVDTSVRLRGTLAGDAFVERLRSLSADSRSLQPITSNPLLLAMLCEVFGEEGDLPRDLTVSELYERYWEEKVARSRTRGPGDPVVIEKPRLCLRIAQHLVKEWNELGQDWIAEPDLGIEGSAAVAQARLELLSEGILKSLANARIRFFHQTFLEYVMARWLTTGSGAAALEKTLGDVSTGENVTLHWWPVLRQLLVLVEPAVFTAIVARLPLENLVAFRAVSFAAVTRADPRCLEDLLRRSLALHAEFQKVLCFVVENAPMRLLGDVWIVLESLLRVGAKDAAVLATATAGELLARGDPNFIPEQLRRLLDALEERVRRTGDHEEGAEVMGQLLRASQPALSTGLAPAAFRLLQERYLSFGDKGRRLVVELFRTAPMDERRRTDFVHFLLERPPERRLQTELTAIYEQMLRFEGAGAKETTKERLEILYRPVPEAWVSFHARAVARLFPEDLLLTAEILQDLFSPNARSPRCDTNAVEEMVELGQADQVCNVLTGMSRESIPTGRIGAITTLVREVSRRTGVESRRNLARWLLPLAESRPQEALEVFAFVADADDGAWKALLTHVWALFDGGGDRLAKRVVGKVPREALGRLAPGIESLASRQPGKASFDYILIDIYSAQIGESEEAVSGLIALSLSHARGVALAASNALVQATREGSHLPMGMLLRLAQSPIPGVRDHFVDAVGAMQKTEHRMAPDELILLCESLGREENASTLQKLCEIVERWVRAERQVPSAAARAMVDLASRLELGQLGAGVAGAVIRVLKVMAQLERPELASLLQEAAWKALRWIEHLNRLSVGESEMTDLLAALARVDRDFLARLVDDGPNLPERNVRALAFAIRRVEGPGSPLLSLMLSSAWCSPYARNAILEFRGA